jgi:hypothetical protein
MRLRVSVFSCVIQFEKKKEEEDKTRFLIIECWAIGARIRVKAKCNRKKPSCVVSSGAVNVGVTQKSSLPATTPHPFAAGVHLKTGIHVSRRTSTRLGEALRASVGTGKPQAAAPNTHKRIDPFSISHTKCLWRLKSHQRKFGALLTTAGDKASSILLTTTPVGAY